MPKKNTKSKVSEVRNKELINKAYKYLFGLTVYFFTTAVLGGIIGGFIDTRFGIKPIGTFSLMTVFYIITIFILRKIYIDFSKKDKK